MNNLMLRTKKSYLIWEIFQLLRYINNIYIIYHIYIYISIIIKYFFAENLVQTEAVGCFYIMMCFHLKPRHYWIIMQPRVSFDRKWGGYWGRLKRSCEATSQYKDRFSIYEYSPALVAFRNIFVKKTVFGEVLLCLLWPHTDIYGSARFFLFSF